MTFIIFTESFPDQRDVFKDVAWPLLLYPISIVPFTYMTSFLFDSDNTAQIFTIFMHFLVAAIAPMIIFFLTTIPDNISLADSMRWWFIPFPSFCVTQSLVMEATMPF